MARPLSDDRSTPIYAMRWLFGVAIGSLIRLVLWILPSSLVRRAMERVLP